MTKTKNSNITVTITSYRKDNRPRHGCEGCGKVVRMNVEVQGTWEYHSCSECGYKKPYRTG